MHSLIFPALKTGLYIVTLKMEDGPVKSFKAVKK